MEISEIRPKYTYENEERTEIREVHKLVKRGDLTLVRYDFKRATDKFIFGQRYHEYGMTFAKLADFAAWADHLTYCEFLHSPGRGSQPKRRNPMAWRGDYDLDD